MYQGHQKLTISANPFRDKVSKGQLQSYHNDTEVLGNKFEKHLVYGRGYCRQIVLMGDVWYLGLSSDLYG